jgi:hypothetical protein
MEFNMGAYGMDEKREIQFPPSINISVKIYSEFGDDPVNPMKLYPEEVTNGRRRVPVYSVPWERAVNLYNAGRLTKESNKMVLDILTGKLTVTIKDYAKRMGVVAPLPIEGVAAGDPRLVSQFDIAGAELKANKEGTIVNSGLLQNDEVQEALGSDSPVVEEQ